MNSSEAVAPIRVRRSTVHGQGVFATRDIKKGTRIREYVGDRVSHGEANRRYKDRPDDDNHTFLFTVDKRLVIDAGVGGNETRFINHSCDPNCETVIEARRVYIEAIRDIRRGEELGYDYLIERDDNDPPNVDQIWACRCGAAKCRGSMLAPRKRKPRVKAEALGVPFEVRRSAVHGSGVFATRDIKKGARVCEYVGDRISHKEADRRYADKPDHDNHTFLFTVSNRTVIDGGVDGNDARFINHSCDPNCESVIEGSRVFIYAIRKIRAGDELGFDYLIGRDDDDPDDVDTVWACRCGAKRCRGSMLVAKKKARAKRAAKKLPSQVKAKAKRNAEPQVVTKAKTKTKAKAKAKAKAKRGR